MADARLHDLPSIEAAVWRELEAATTRKGHDWRHGVLATVDGDAADARTVVLRDLDAAARALLVYTDARSPKVRQLDAHPIGTLVLWSARLGWQLRLRVALEVETSGLAVSSRWARLKMTPAAHDYLSPLPPGSPIADPLHAAVLERGTREYFAVLSARVMVIDWLELHAEGHRRAGFDAQGAHWRTP